MAIPDGTSLAERAKHSDWVGASPGLADAVAAWETASESDPVSDDVAEVLRPGPITPPRALRQLISLQFAGVRAALDTIPRLLSDDLAALRDPGAIAMSTALNLVHDELGGLGASGAELGQIIEASDGLVPGPAVAVFRRRPLEVDPLPGAVVRGILRRAFDGAVARVDDGPIVALPLSQLHRAQLDDGRRVLVRVRRPGIAGELHGDLKLLANLLVPLEAAFPAVRTPHPLAFVELAARQVFEAVDLRNEARNAVELGLVIESLGIEGLSVLRPVPELVHQRAAVFEDVAGDAFPAGADDLDPAVVVPALAGVILESALAQGAFLADLRPENFLVGPGGLTVVGTGTVGRFDLAMRRSVLGYLMAVFSGDFTGQLDHLRALGAVPAGTDTVPLLAELAADESLNPMTMLMGGEDSLVAGLQNGVALLVRHGIRPPGELALFVRNVFGLRRLVHQLPPGGGLLAALMPMVQRLPVLAQELAEP